MPSFWKATFRHSLSQKTACTLWPRRLTQLSNRNEQTRGVHSVAVKNTMARSNSQEGQIYLASISRSQPITEGSQEGTQAELDAGAIKGMFHIGLAQAPHSQTPYTAQVPCPEICATHSGRGLPHQSLTKTIPHRLAHRPIGAGQPLNRDKLTVNR